MAQNTGGAGATAPAETASTVTPSDSTAVSFRALYVGTSGNITVDVIGGGTGIVFKNCQGILPVSVSKVYSTGTTATDIVGLR